MNFKLIIAFSILFSLSSCIKDEFYNKDGNNKDNFNLLWKTIDESYCYFDYKNINWDSVYNIYSPKVSNEMSKYDFFDVCKNMLRELQDGHVNLVADFNVMSYDDFYLDYPQNFNNTIVERNYLGEDYINAYRLRAKNINGIGYLRYESFMNLLTRTNLQEAITQLGNIEGLIIDVRDNTGGYLAMVDTLVSNLCANDLTFGYISYKNGKGHSDFSELYPQKIEVKLAPVYNGNIVILTNRKVFSAANCFVSAMSCLENVTLIGDVTGGGGAAPFTSELYNGWQVINSRNPLYDKDMQHIEFGINPDIKIDMDPLQEMNGVDSNIEFAIDFLLKQK